MLFKKQQSSLFRAESSITLNDIAKLVAKPMNDHINYFNRMAARDFRSALRETFAKDADLKNFGKIVDNLKVEHRSLGQARVGSGFSIKLTNNKLETKMLLFDDKMMKVLGRDGFWKLKTLTEGQYTISLTGGKPQPYRVHKSDPRSQGDYDQGKGRKYESLVDPEPSKQGVAFHMSRSTKKITRATRRIDWMKEAEALAVNKLVERINKRK